MKDLISKRLMEYASQPGVVRRGWLPPGLDQFATGHIFALDQSLTNTGVVRMEISEQGLIVHEKFTIRPLTDRESFWGSYDKTEGTLNELINFFRIWPMVKDVVCEMPAVGGMRTDSSLLAGYAAYRASKAAGKQLSMVSMLHTRKVLGGPTCKTKYDLKLALAKILPASQRRPWNEHTRDGLGLGLTHLYDRKQAQDSE